MLQLLKELLLNKNAASITEIDFTDKAITEIDNLSYETISKFQNLKSFNLRNNEISQLPENLSQLKKL